MRLDGDLISALYGTTSLNFFYLFHCISWGFILYFNMEFLPLNKRLPTMKTTPPTFPTMVMLTTALQGLLMCVKYYLWHKCYWQTWLDSWGSDLPAYLMHIHLLYPTGLARALELCHLATLQLPPKCIVTLIMQICILFSPNTCIRNLLHYWNWDTGLSVRNLGEIWGNLRHFFISTLHNSCHIKWDSDEKHALMFTHTL